LFINGSIDLLVSNIYAEGMRLIALLSVALFAAVATTQAKTSPIKYLAGNYVFSANLINAMNIGDGSWKYDGGVKISSKGKIKGSGTADGPTSSNYAYYPVNFAGKVRVAGKTLKLEIKTSDGAKLIQTYSVGSRYVTLKKSSMRKGGFTSTSSPLKKL